MNILTERFWNIHIISLSLKEAIMLAIEREPLYKNKLLLSTLAVATGFIITVGIIRAVSPADTTNESAQTSSDRRSSSLIPINASESESSSESGSSTEENPEAKDQTEPVATQPAQSPSGGQSTWTAPAPKQSSTAAQPAPAPTQSTATAPAATSPAPQPEPTEPAEQNCTVGLLDLVCI